MNKIQTKGKDFILQIFRGVNEFLFMLFESLMVMYDPNDEGYLELIERDLDKLLLDRTLQGQTYFILLVFSRVINKDNDKDLRFKAAALENATP